MLDIPPSWSSVRVFLAVSFCLSLLLRNDIDEKLSQPSVWNYYRHSYIFVVASSNQFAKKTQPFMKGGVAMNTRFELKLKNCELQIDSSYLYLKLNDGDVCLKIAIRDIAKIFHMILQKIGAAASCNSPNKHLLPVNSSDPVAGTRTHRRSP